MGCVCGKLRNGGESGKVILGEVGGACGELGGAWR